MHLLHFTPALRAPSNGLAAAVSGMTDALRALGCRADIATTEVLADSAGAGEPATGGRVFACPPSTWPGLRQWQYAARLERELTGAFDAAPPDILHAHGTWLYPQHLAAQLARRWGRPLVVSTHGALEPNSFRHHQWKKLPVWWLSARRSLQQAALLVATSPLEAENVRRRGFRNPIAVIPLGVALPDANAAGGPPAVRTDARHTALFLGRLHPGKGLVELVAAVAELRPADWQFVIAGPDADGHRATLERAIRKSGTAAFFTFTGPVDGPQKERLYQTAELLVLPSRGENFGLAVAEALAHGVPAVTTTATPWRDSLGRHRCGWVCEPTAAGMAQALAAAFAATEETRREMGARGRRLIEEQFSWPRIARQLQAAYDWLRHGGQPPPFVEGA